MERKRILITGASGFIGSHLYVRLLEEGHDVIGMDNRNNHLYKHKLKDARKHEMKINVWDTKDIRSNDDWHYMFKHSHDAIQDTQRWHSIVDQRNDARKNGKDDRGFDDHPYFDFIIHLAAHAGVRDSFGKEQEYHSNNIDGTQTLIEFCKSLPKKHQPKIIYASTSSVYGGTPITENGWKEDFVQAHQLNAYAYSKYMNECQFKISGLQNVGLRFFTVYGPWGRPDMALFQFTKKILDGQQIDVYNYGNMKRDFTFIDDIIDGIVLTLENFDRNAIQSGEIFNIGRGEQVELMDFIKAIERETGKKAIMNLCPKHPADTQETWSNTDKLQELGYDPKVSIDEGVKRFYNWYKKWIPKLGDVTNG